jgi:hypothetical protein
MPAEADLFSLKEFFSSQKFKAVVFKVGFIFHEIFDVIEVLVNIIDVIVSCF